MNSFINALKMFFAMTLLTGLLYPFLVYMVAQVIFPYKAHGSKILQNDQIIGSALIAQKITADKYFWPRPSAINFDPLAPSGGSNLAVTSKKLLTTVKEREAKLGPNAPLEMVYSSGSGLDPHINLANAYFQAKRIAQARGIDEAKLIELINKHKEGHFFHHGYVNVLELNLALNEEYDGRR